MSEYRYISDMRQRIGLKADDASRDQEIEAMTPTRRLALICGWHMGYPGWEHTFLNWARDAGFKISEPTSASLHDRGQP